MRKPKFYRSDIGLKSNWVLVLIAISILVITLYLAIWQAWSWSWQGQALAIVVFLILECSILLLWMGSKIDDNVDIPNH